MKKRERNKKMRIIMIIILLEIFALIFIKLLIIKDDNQKQENQAILTSSANEVNTTKKVQQTSMPVQTPEKYKYKAKITYKKGKMLSKHTITNYYSSSNRNTNMKVAADIINCKNNKKGYLMMPGDTFSWLETVGNTTEEKGFKMATVIVNKQHAEGLGGGVCQVASTINSAIIKAGLKTNSQKHSISVGYLGANDYEATVSYDSGKDLSFKNTFDYPIKIKVSTNGGSVTAKVFKMKKKIRLIKYINRKK